LVELCAGAELGAAVALVRATTLAARFGIAAGTGDGDAEADTDGIGVIEAAGPGVAATGAPATGAAAAGAAADCDAGDGNAIVPAAPADEELLAALIGAPGEPGSAGSLYDAFPKVEVNGEEAKTGRSATVAALRTSPRTSIVVS